MPDINLLLARLLSVDPNIITWLVIVVCVGLLFSHLVTSRLRDIAPVLMISAGIIGTFWGTLIALARFETRDSEGGIDHEAMVNSIPDVLGGMETAFITTLVGLGFAFGYRIFLRWRTDPKPLKIEQDAVDLLTEIKEGIVGKNDGSLSSKLDRLQAETRDGANSIKQAIAGEGDSSIASQLIALRNENSDGLKQLDGRMDGLAEAIRESLVTNMQALIDEIKTVIADQLVVQLNQTNELLRDKLSEMLDRIEKALIEQFGETFIQFNEATQAIKKWQEEHRQQVEQLTEAFAVTASGIERIRADCESIPATMEQLRSLMGELDERLQAFADMKTSAEQSFPIIKAHLDSIGDDLQKSASGFSGLEQTIRQTHEKAGELAQQHIEVARGHIESVGAQINQTTEHVAKAVERVIAESENASAQHQEKIHAIMESVSRESEKCIATTQSAMTEIGEHTKQHAKQVGEQINRTADQVKTAADSMLANTKAVSDQHEQTVRNMVNSIQAESERSVTVTAEALTKMAEKHAQATNDAMAAIIKEWGENVVGIAKKAQEVIERRQQ